MSVQYFVAATDRLSWGRGSTEWEAIAHALHHAGRSVRKVVLYSVSCPEGASITGVFVNEMGSIVAPSGSEISQLADLEIGKLADLFWHFQEEVMDRVYP